MDLEISSIPLSYLLEVTYSGRVPLVLATGDEPGCRWWLKAARKTNAVVAAVLICAQTGEVTDALKEEP